MTFVPPEVKKKMEGESSKAFVPPEVQKKDVPAAPASPAGTTNNQASLPVSSEQTGTNPVSTSSSFPGILSQRSNILKSPLPTTEKPSYYGLPAIVFNQQLGAPERPKTPTPPTMPLVTHTLQEALQQGMQETGRLGVPKNIAPMTPEAEVVPGIPNKPTIVDAPSVTQVMSAAQKLNPGDDVLLKANMSKSYNQFNENWKYNEQVAAQMPGGENLYVPQGIERTRKAYESYLRQYDPQALDYYYQKLDYAKKEDEAPDLSHGEKESFPGEDPVRALLTRNANYDFDSKAIQFAAQAVSNNIQASGDFLQKNYPVESKLYSQYVSQSNGYVSQLEQMQKSGVQPDDPNFKTTLAAYQDLQEKMGIIEQMPGFAENKQAIEVNAAEYEKIFEQSKSFVKDFYPEIYKQQQEQQAQEDTMDYADRGEYEKIADPMARYDSRNWVNKNISNPMTNTVVSAVNKLAYLPKAFGDGDDYGWTDALYERTKNATGSLHLPVAGHYEIIEGRKVFKENFIPQVAETATNMALMVAGSTLTGGALSTLGGGFATAEGAATALSYKIATVATGTAMTMDGYYEAGIQAGMSEKEAERFSIASGTVQGLLELVNPEAAIGNSVMKKSAQTYMDVLAKGSSVSVARREAMKTIGKEIVGENIQEVTQQLAEYSTNYMANEITGTNLDVGKHIGDDLVQTVILTTIVAGGMGGVMSLTGPKGHLTSEALYYAASDAEGYKAKILKMQQDGEIDPKKAELLTNNISKAQEAIARMPQGMQETEKIQALPHVLQKMELEEKQKAVDKVYKPEVQKEIEAVEEKIREVSGIKSPEEEKAAESIKDGDASKAIPLSEDEENHLHDLLLHEGEGLVLNEKESQVVSELKRRQHADFMNRIEQAKDEPTLDQVMDKADQMKASTPELVDAIAKRREEVKPKEPAAEGEVKAPVVEEVKPEPVESLDETTAPFVDDATVVERFKKDIEVLNNTTGNVLSKDGVVKKFVAVSNRIHTAMKEGKISKETAITFMNAAKNARNRKVKDPINEAEERVINTLKSLKLISNDTTGPYGGKVTKNGLDLEDVVRLAFRMAEHAIIKGSDAKVAIDRAINTMRQGKSYQKFVTLGSKEDQEIESRIRTEMEDQKEKVAAMEQKTMKPMDRIVNSKSISSELKDAFQSKEINGSKALGTMVYATRTVAETQALAKEYVERFKDDLDTLADVIKDPQSGLDFTSRGAIAIEMFTHYKSQLETVTDPQERKALIEKIKDAYEVGARINSENGQGLSILGRIMKDALSDEEVYMAIREKNADDIVDAIVGANKKNIAKTVTDINKLKSQNVKGEALKKGIKEAIKKHLLDLTDAQLEGMVNTIAKELDGKDTISNAKIAELYTQAMKDHVFGEEMRAKIKEELDKKKKADDQEKVVRGLINDYVKAEEEAVSSGAPMSKAQHKEWRSKIMGEYRTLSDMTLIAQEANRKVSRMFKDPRGVWDALRGSMVGNLLGTMTVLKNISGYPFAMILRGATRVPATAIDWMQTQIYKKNFPNVTMSTNPIAEIAGGFKYGTLPSLKESARRLYTGHVNPDVEKLELSATNDFVDDLKDLFSKRKVGERNFVQNKISAFIGGVLGAPGSAIFRLLGPPDIMARQISEKGRLAEMAANENKKGGKLLEAILFPDEESQAIAKEAGLRSSYQNSTEFAKKINDWTAFKKTEQIPVIGNFLAGMAKFMLTGIIPYKGTPINLGYETLEYVNPFVGLTRGIMNSAKAVDAAKNGNEKVSADYRRMAAKNFSNMALAYGLGYVATQFLKYGLLTGSDADREDSGVKAERKRLIPANSLNWSAFMRLMTGDKNWHEIHDEDTWVSLSGLGTMGMALGTHANMKRDVSPSQIAEENSLFTDVTFRTILPSIHSMMDNTFLKGTNDALSAIYETGSRGNYFTKSYLTTLSASLYANIYANASATSDDYIRDTKGDGTLNDMLLNTFKNRTFQYDNLEKKVSVWGEDIKSVPPGTSALAYYVYDPLKSHTIPNQGFDYRIFDAMRNVKDVSLRAKYEPDPPSNKITVNKQSMVLTPKEYHDYQVYVGQQRRKLAENYVLSGSWKNDDEVTRAETLSKLYAQGTRMGKRLFITDPKNPRFLAASTSTGTMPSFPNVDLNNVKLPTVDLNKVRIK